MAPDSGGLHDGDGDRLRSRIDASAKGRLGSRLAWGSRGETEARPERMLRRFSGEEEGQCEFRNRIERFQRSSADRDLPAQPLEAGDARWGLLDRWYRDPDHESKSPGRLCLMPGHPGRRSLRDPGPCPIRLLRDRGWRSGVHSYEFPTGATPRLPTGSSIAAAERTKPDDSEHSRPGAGARPQRSIPRATACSCTAPRSRIRSAACRH